MSDVNSKRILVLLCFCVVCLILTLSTPSTRAGFTFTFQLTKTWIVKQEVAAANSSRDEIHVFNPDDLNVHFVKIYPTSAPTAKNQLCFLECVALLSVFKHLTPKAVFLHTTAPDFWPFTPCQSIVSNLTIIKVVTLVPTTRVGNKHITIVHHQADIAKLEILRDHGGVVMDMDVFVINGHVIREVLENFTCMLSQEGSEMLNAGYAACRKGAKWPAVILKLYEKDYRPDWYYNSAILPFKTYRSSREFQQSVYVDDTISDNPEGKVGYKMLDMKGVIDWRRKVAFQSFYHNCKLSVGYVNDTQTGFGELLRWILYDIEPSRD